MNRFRPQELPKSWVYKQRLTYGRSETYNFQTRIKWHPAGWGLNKKVIGGQFQKLHYLACHAPGPIQNKWKNAYSVFYKKHFGSKNISIRFANKYTCHSWL
jgi:hypothetical protein